MTNDERLTHIQLALGSATGRLNSFTFDPKKAIRDSLTDVRSACAMLQELDNILSGVVPPGRKP